ncbi:peptidoglycan DD-metalloendopeptidase family protein [Legionella jordanis]|uniref:LysM domain-containing protein n=1 Tax=Legionella jordanis TaxID=456 RepID=A0A0W0V7X0_9GAMM|nr:peptidoglycan DD-metalloendopeptidase family protein [Legionella jordanis]KTD16220.1 hypothetical protein Ljor_0526 [Legionella jordanis]VEH12322.1 lipoprotein NlpD [Legionella jordanis]
MMIRLLVAIFIVLLAGCETRTTLAPVVEGQWRARTNYQGKHVVQAGETLYAVAFRYDIDYRQLAAYNHLQSPYNIRVGQVLKIGSTAPRFITTPKTIHKPYPVKRATIKKGPSHYTTVKTYYRPTGKGNWVWPVNGRIATNFVPQEGKKGIDIAGKKGERIRAASSGIVAYAGSGLSGYGNLIIIKHNNQFLTAYGNNLKNLVKEGQTVKAGQVIAEMGMIDRRFWGVHFEIRMAGKPVNPLIYLRN